MQTLEISVEWASRCLEPQVGILGKFQINPIGSWKQEW